MLVSLAAQFPCSASCVDLGRPHLHQGELGRDEKPVDQDQTGDDQDLNISHVGRNPVLVRVAQAGVVGRPRDLRIVDPRDRAGADVTPATVAILTESPRVDTPEFPR